MTKVYPSTNGLSVYNALRNAGAMNEVQVLRFLRQHWDGSFRPAAVREGLEFLERRNFIKRDGESWSATRRELPLLRSDSDRELVYGT